MLGRVTPEALRALSSIELVAVLEHVAGELRERGLLAASARAHQAQATLLAELVHGERV